VDLATTNDEDSLDTALSNEHILGMVDECRSLLETLRKRQKNWIGHVVRLYLKTYVSSCYKQTPYYRKSSKEGFRERKPPEDHEQCYWVY